MPSPAVSDHLRPTDDGAPDGVYRVVGTDGESVTLLRVGDADERRVHTGEIVRVARGDLDGFEAAENPDKNRSLWVVLVVVVRDGYWSVRTFGQQLVRNPLPAALAMALVVAGSVGDSFVSAPAEAFAALIILGALALALVGSGRF